MIHQSSQFKELNIPNGDIEQYRVKVDRPMPIFVYRLPYRDGYVFAKMFKDGINVGYKTRLKQLFRKLTLAPHTSYVWSASQKKQIEEDYLSLWYRYNYPAPKLLSLHIPGHSPDTTVIMEYVNGFPLVDILRNSKLTMKERLAMVASILRHMDERHNTALAQNEAKLIHPDANPGNILVDGKSFTYIDFVRTAQYKAPVPVLAAHELRKFIKGVVESIGRDKFDDVIQLVLSTYGNSTVTKFLMKPASSNFSSLFRGFRYRLRHTKNPAKLDRFSIAERLQKAYSENINPPH